EGLRRTMNIAIEDAHRRSEVQHDLIALDGDVERLDRAGDAVGALDRDLVGADARVGRRVGAAGGHVVAPAVPGAHEQAPRDALDSTGRRRDDAVRDPSRAERGSLVRAAVADRVELVADTEDTDLAPAHPDDAPASGRKLDEGADDVAHRALLR